MPKSKAAGLTRRQMLKVGGAATFAGYAVGGGHVLHVLCDLSIASETARFGQAGPKVGSFDGGFGASLLAAQIGQKRAKKAVANTKPSLPLEKYAGRYRDPWRDDATIALDGGRPHPLVRRAIGMVDHQQRDPLHLRRSGEAQHRLALAVRAETLEALERLKALDPAGKFVKYFMDQTAAAEWLAGRRQPAPRSSRQAYWTR